MASDQYTIGVDHGNGVDSCWEVVVIDAGMTTGTIYIIPHRRENESEEDWLSRCAVIFGIGPKENPDGE